MKRVERTPMIVPAQENHTGKLVCGAVLGNHEASMAGTRMLETRNGLR